MAQASPSPAPPEVPRPAPADALVARYERDHGVTLRTLPARGQSLFAAREFPANATVLEEDAPLLEYGAKDPHACFLAFAAAQPEVQQTILDSLYRPQARDAGHLACVQKALEAAADAKEAHGDELGAFTAAALADVALCCAMNSVEVGDNTRAVFEVGAKLNHSCAPNVALRTRGAARPRYTALRAIAPGEELTTSYLDVGCALGHGLWSGPARRRLLQRSFVFQCSCSACEQPGKDLHRGATCPLCADGQGVMYCNGKAWVCGACEAELELEAGTALDVENLLFSGGTDPGGSSASVELRLETLALAHATKVEMLSEATFAKEQKEEAAERAMEEAAAAVRQGLGLKHWATQRLALARAHFHARKLALLSRAIAAHIAGNLPSQEGSAHQVGKTIIVSEQVVRATQAIPRSVKAVADETEQAWAWTRSVAGEAAPGLLWRSSEHTAAALIGTAAAVAAYAHIAREKVERAERDEANEVPGLAEHDERPFFLCAPADLKQMLEYGGLLLKRISPAAEAWFDPDALDLQAGHGLRVGRVLKDLDAQRSDALKTIESLLERGTVAPPDLSTIPDHMA